MLTTGILLIMVIIMLARSIIQDWRTVQSVQRGVQAMELAYRAMKAAEKASAERGPAIPVLNDTEPPDAAKRQRLAIARAASDSALAEAIDGVAVLDGAPYAAALAQLRKAQDELAQARREVDRVAALPHAQRSASGTRITRMPIDLMFGVIDTLLEAVTTLSAQAEMVYPELTVPLVGARYGAELREYAGRLGSQFTAPLASQKPLGAEEQRDIPQIVGRIQQLRKLIEVLSRTQLSDARVREAIGEMNKRYFGVGLPFIDSLTQAGMAGTPYGIESAAFVSRYVPEMTSIVQLRDRMFQVARDGAIEEVRQARRRMMVNAIIGLAILLVEIAVFVIIQRYVLRPLLANTRAMNAIVGGTLGMSLPPATRSDEIGDMQRAVAALLDTSQKKLALEQEREQLINDLRNASNIDFLTKLHNRRAFAERAAAQLAQARRQGWPLALISFDIDHFKLVNDTHGHAVGDTVLARMAAIAQAHFRESDELARYGGEEFVALAPNCNAGDALQLADRVRTAFEQADMPAANGGVFHVTASFGVVTAHANDVAGIDALVRAADEALYRAKAGGRNRVVIETFSAGVRTSVAAAC